MISVSGRWSRSGLDSPQEIITVLKNKIRLVYLGEFCYIHLFVICLCHNFLSQLKQLLTDISEPPISAPQ